MKRCQPAAPEGPSHSLTAVAFANNYTLPTLSGNAQPALIATIARDATTNTTLALTLTRFASQNQRVWYPLLIAAPPVGWDAGVQQQRYTQDITRTIGGTMVRTLRTMTTIGRPNHAH